LLPASARLDVDNSIPIKKDAAKVEKLPVEVGENENLGILISNLGVVLAAISSLFAKFLLNN